MSKNFGGCFHQEGGEITLFANYSLIRRGVYRGTLYHLLDRTIWSTANCRRYGLTNKNKKCWFSNLFSTSTKYTHFVSKNVFDDGRNHHGGKP